MQLKKKMLNILKWYMLIIHILLRNYYNIKDLQNTLKILLIGLQTKVFNI